MNELRSYRAAGGTSLVDAQPIGSGRNIGRLAEAARQSRVNIIAVTGYHLPYFYPPGHWIHTASEARLTDLFSSELREGACADGAAGWPTARTPWKAGIVKAALADADLDHSARRLLSAAGRAAAEQGFALLLHTAAGRSALPAIELLGQLGLPPERILICHADRQVESLAIHLAIARTGAWLEFDTIGRFKYHDNQSEIRLIQHLLAAGHAGRLLLSLDTTAARMSSYGGSIGLDYLLTVFLPLMRQAGISQALCDRITRDNPGQALACQVT